MYRFPESVIGVYSWLYWQPLPAKGRARPFFGVAGSHTDASWGTALPFSVKQIRTGQSNTRSSFGAKAPFSCTFRLDPHAAFPDTRARSLNTSSVSKNVPDRNLVRLRFHANTRQVGFAAFSSFIHTRPLAG